MKICFWKIEPNEWILNNYWFTKFYSDGYFSGVGITLILKNIKNPNKIKQLRLGHIFHYKYELDAAIAVYQKYGFQQPYNYLI